MPLSGFTHASFYTWDYVTSGIELNFSSFCFLLFLCIWINIAAVLLQSQPLKPDVIITQSHAFHADLRH